MEYWRKRQVPLSAVCKTCLRANDLIGSLTGGNATTPSAGGINLNGILEQLRKGGSVDNSGGLDLRDIISQVTQAAQQKQEQQARGNAGMSDLIKGFFN